MLYCRPGVSGRDQRERGERALALVGLADRADHTPSQLSGGQQQRVAIARALVNRPPLLFADEPTGNLDSRSGAEVLNFLRRSVRDFGQTIVMVTHEPDIARYAKRRVVMRDGEIVSDAPVEERTLSLPAASATQERT